MYVGAPVDLDLDTWVSIRRPRVYILMVRKDTTDAARLARTAVCMAESLERERARDKPVLLSRFLIHPTSPDWLTHVSGFLSMASPPSAVPKPKRWKGERPMWETDSETMREKWATLQQPGHSAQPLKGAALQGVAAHQQAKVRTLGELVLINAAHVEEKHVEDAAAVEELKSGLFMDITQSWTFQNKGRKRDVRSLKCLVTGSRVYSFEADRLVSPAELLRAHGWDFDGTAGMPPLNLVGITNSQAHDLLGESMAVQSCSVALWSLLAATGEAMKDVWPDAVQQ